MEDFNSLVKTIRNSTNILTTKREFVLKEIFFSKKPLNAKEIQISVKESANINISLPTLYTSLQIFEEYHILNSIFISSKKTRYYFVKGVTQNFLICTNCGKIESFDDERMNERAKTISKEKSFVLFNQKALLYGICEECKK